MASLRPRHAPLLRAKTEVIYARKAAETERLIEDRDRKKNWKRWGPYLSERQWGTVREDYSSDGSCWSYFPHDHARSRAYRWGEDGLLGITDRQCRLCFALALWNGSDPILKERLFGLTGPQGNHGEDVKECYYYLDSTPTHSYMKALYKYPLDEFPYARLEREASAAGIDKPEFELEDAGAFDDDNYCDVFATYAKNSPDDVIIKITVANRSAKAAQLHLLPTLWFRNTWIWGCTHEGCTLKASIRAVSDCEVECRHDTLDKFRFYVCPDSRGKTARMLFTENETNSMRLWNVEQYTSYTKDAFHRYVINGDEKAVNPKKRGTKVAPHFVFDLGAREEDSVYMRLVNEKELGPDKTAEISVENAEAIIAARKMEADEFYSAAIPANLDEKSQLVARQAYAGLLWSKQFYHYVVEDWLYGDKDQVAPPEGRLQGRNADWMHLFNRDVVSMPDKWEYPWYASWDLAFHMIPFARIDPQFAKDQLILFLREWYMHPNGQIPAYEFAFGDVNPPVHAWAVWRVYKMTGKRGERDQKFLARCFQKLILNFNWWVNRKDPDGKNIFAGGFLGLDNIGLFDRSKPLSPGFSLEQADGTAWMCFYCITMLDIALELALEDPVYEDMASKFFEHFVMIVDAMNQLADGHGLWNEEDGFYYDHLRRPDGGHDAMKIRSMVGLIPLYACLVLDDKKLQKLPDFKKRLKWFLEYKKGFATHITKGALEGEEFYHLLAIPTRSQLERVLDYLVDEDEFLSPYGIRSLSKVHQDKPFEYHCGGESLGVSYTPGESNTHLFGGNSNWRGPIWLCVNYLLIESLERYHYFYGDSLQVECPKGSGVKMNLREVALELCHRMSRLFLPGPDGSRPCHGDSEKYRSDPHWNELVLFYEYFHGDTGRGCGASHQTGWTAVITRCLDRCAKADVCEPC